MKIVKLTMLAATAVVAALIGASSAAAVTHPVIQFCKAQELVLCTKANLIKHPLKGRLLLTAGLSKFKAIPTLECASGMGDSNEFEGFGNGKIDQELVELTFIGCKGCEKVDFTKNQKLTIDMGTQLGDDWSLSIPNATMTFVKCTGGVSCKFQGSVKVGIQMDAEGSFFDVEKENQSFKFIEGSKVLCGETCKWELGNTDVTWRLDDGVKQTDGTLGTSDFLWPTLLEVLTQT